jgi:hypothetical protein
MGREQLWTVLFYKACSARESKGRGSVRRKGGGSSKGRKLRELWAVKELTS